MEFRVENVANSHLRSKILPDSIHFIKNMAVTNCPA